MSQHDEASRALLNLRLLAANMRPHLEKLTFTLFRAAYHPPPGDSSLSPSGLGDAWHEWDAVRRTLDAALAQLEKVPFVPSVGTVHARVVDLSARIDEGKFHEARALLRVLEDLVGPLHSEVMRLRMRLDFHTAAFSDDEPPTQP